ncbi:MAG: nucleoside-diphosphate kinase [Candidatus Margulisbacteria bacterium]|nr:nucleoside-diphosphate kinase [Candidatus Margulisiibacteriota bacterium]MBU1022468.1 nucleoside-diphosphate kinase [Candidatus Margulisiibacteriota bacterium]MBU1728452.1 nucleoside-diphosphate kinase [Candidatus Margulisiibacteriota bacterium]MBU1954599.1 nucleoside-diphosphate kinase [Candidatus Margulisiibacteriota bacterium]
MERTFFMIKPDGVRRELRDEIIKRVKVWSFNIVTSKKLTIAKPLAEKLYAMHRGKPFYDGLVRFITSGPVEVFVLEGDNIIMGLRDLMGTTDPRKAKAETIRGDLREENVLNHEGIIKNLVHGSDSIESAKYEIPIFFGKEFKV